MEDQNWLVATAVQCGVYIYRNRRGFLRVTTITAATMGKENNNNTAAFKSKSSSVSKSTLIAAISHFLRDSTLKSSAALGDAGPAGSKCQPTSCCCCWALFLFVLLNHGALLALPDGTPQRLISFCWAMAVLYHIRECVYVRARERDLYTLPHADIIITPNHLVINYKSEWEEAGWKNRTTTTTTG